MPDEQTPADTPADFSVDDFEWDEEKNETNIRKHGIDFVRARRVFLDLAAVVMEGAHRSDEERHLIVGQLDGALVTVVYTLRGERIRIISARRARESERKRYGH